MKDNYISYNAMDDVAQQDDSEAIVSAANKKRKGEDKEALTRKKPRARLKATEADGPRGKRKRKARVQPKPKSPKQPRAKAGTAPKSKRKQKQEAAAASSLLMSSQGLVTRGIHAGMRGAEIIGGQTRRVSTSGWCGLAAAMIVMTVTILAWTRAPEPPFMPLSWHSFQVSTEQQQLLPEKIWRSYVNKYPAIKSWVIKGEEQKHFKNPTQNELEHFAAYLEEQGTIEEVNDIKLSYVERGEKLQRAMCINVSLRLPEMPVILANGQKAWVDDNGILLPGLMPVPEACQNRPVVRDIEEHPEALQEVLDFWPRLEAVIEADLISSIYLNHVMQRSVAGTVLQRGIVLTTRQGTRIHWGRAGDERYGLSADDKIRNLLRTLKSQGDLNNTSIIDVRHSQPNYVLARGS